MTTDLLESMEGWGARGKGIMTIKIIISITNKSYAAKRGLESVTTGSAVKRASDCTIESSISHFVAMFNAEAVSHWHLKFKYPELTHCCQMGSLE